MEKKENNYNEEKNWQKSNEEHNCPCCMGNPHLRTDYKESMEPSRGDRTYPYVKIIKGKTT